MTFAQGDWDTLRESARGERVRERECVKTQSKRCINIKISKCRLSNDAERAAENSTR